MFFLSISITGQKKNIFEVGEELTYEVSYLFIKIGELKFRIAEKYETPEGIQYKAVGQINSYSHIPFITLNEIVESKMTDDPVSHYFRALHLGYKPPRFSKYEIDYDEATLHVTRGVLKPFKIKVDSTCDLNQQIQDGLSLLYYARNGVGKKNSVQVPSFIGEQFKDVKLNFHDGTEGIEISAVDYEIDCTQLDGQFDFVGLYGLTGKFKGWFSNDEFSVPIVGTLNVLIGELTIELKSWRKPGWIPPKKK
ncbi:MAG: DUF3108 domain-containing protein [Bacteroidetes bacterium]|nr:DUF3108 domain-containing protein [Bacteroidota bacterium]